MVTSADIAIHWGTALLSTPTANISLSNTAPGIQIPASLSLDDAATLPVAVEIAAILLDYRYESARSIKLVAPWEEGGKTLYAAGEPAVVLGALPASDEPIRHISSFNLLSGTRRVEWHADVYRQTQRRSVQCKETGLAPARNEFNRSEILGPMYLELPRRT